MRPLHYLPHLLAPSAASPLATTRDPAASTDVKVDVDLDLRARQLGGSGTTRNDLVGGGGCGRAVVVFARGTTGDVDTAGAELPADMFLRTDGFGARDIAGGGCRAAGRTAQRWRARPRPQRQVVVVCVARR